MVTVAGSRFCVNYKRTAPTLRFLDDYDVVVVALTCVAKRAACGCTSPPPSPKKKPPGKIPPFIHGTHSNEASEPET